MSVFKEILSRLLKIFRVSSLRDVVKNNSTKISALWQKRAALGGGCLVLIFSPCFGQLSLGDVNSWESTQNQHFTDRNQPVALQLSDVDPEPSVAPRRPLERQATLNSADNRPKANSLNFQTPNGSRSLNSSVPLYLSQVPEVPPVPDAAGTTPAPQENGMAGANEALPPTEPQQPTETPQSAGAQTPSGTPSNSAGQPGSAEATPAAQPTDPAQPNAKPDPFALYLTIPSPANSLIDGQAFPLENLLERVSSPQERYLRIHDYWTLAEKLALYNIYRMNLAYANMFSKRYPSPNDIPANIRPLLGTTFVLAIQRAKEAEIHFVQEQYEFASKYQLLKGEDLSRALESPNALNVPSQNEQNQQSYQKRLPLPNVSPSLEPYNTRFEEMSKQRPLSSTAKMLGVTIPMQYEVVQHRLEEEKQTLNSFSVLLKTKELSVKDDVLIDALNQNIQAKVDLVSAVMLYNRMIAAYVAETVGNQLEGSRYMATLNLSRPSGDLTDSVKLGQVYDPYRRSSASGAAKKLEKQGYHRSSGSSRADKNRQPNRPQTFKAYRPETLIIRGQDPNLPAESPGEMPPLGTPVGGTPPGEAGQAPANPNPSMTGSDAGTVGNNPTLTVPPAASAPFPAADSAMTPTSAPQTDAAAATPPAQDKPENSAPVAPSIPKELSDQIAKLTETLFPVQEKSGAGDSSIIEMPLTLRDAVARNRDYHRRLEVVESYWTLRTLLAELEIENKIAISTLQMLQVLQKQFSDAASNPEKASILGMYLASLNRSQARILEKKIEIRNHQVDLMSKINGSVENGWPIPVTKPFWGPSYKLETGQIGRNTFVLITETVLIPEKMKTIQNIAGNMGPPEVLFQPNFPVNEPNDAILFLKILENKRLMAISYVELLQSLNISIARYVSDFSASPIENQIFVDCLIGPDNQ